MVHIKRIELTNFKSFGGTTKIPLLPGFTVISGPNGSGKSNILDALLFCLGISSSKGMRAERLPDLVNHNQVSQKRGTVEASVTVTFDLGEEPMQVCPLAPAQLAEISDDAESEEKLDDTLTRENQTNGYNPREWSITRKLRVTKQGTYTSTYYINGSPCTLTELHEQLNRLRIYPEGYNVVLQGDVTSIISMNPRERREIIDELAGVAAFDRKIALAKEKLEQVKETEERNRIVEQELRAQLERLSQDRAKAEKYQKLRAELLDKQKWEAILVWRQYKQQEWVLREQIEASERSENELLERLTGLRAQIQSVTERLNQLNARVKALGEDELLSLQSTLARQEAEKHQLQQRQKEIATACQYQEYNIAQTEKKIKEYQQEIEQLTQLQATEVKNIEALSVSRDAASEALERLREEAKARAKASEAWVQQQTDLHHQIETLQSTLAPLRSQQARLQEKVLQLENKIQEEHQRWQEIEKQRSEKTDTYAHIENLQASFSQQREFLEQELALAEKELQTLQETQKRLLKEQREVQRQLDKLEAQAQVIQETSGTGASQIILQAGLTGVYGLVAQLGCVQPRYQLALETAAGGRLGYLVVENDAVAAAGIQLLKEKRGGRATFLPLNKIRAPRFTPVEMLHRAQGFIDYAVNLIEYDPRYKEVFAFVFSNTAVFDEINNARPYLGQVRIVTLEGDLLETTGAMTGGSFNSGGARLHFGTGSGEVGEQTRLADLRARIQEIEQVLAECSRAIEQAQSVSQARSSQLAEVKQQQRDALRQAEQLRKDLENMEAQQEQLRAQLVKNTQELSDAQARLQVLEVELPGQEAQMQQLRMALAELEQSQTHSEWLSLQANLQKQENELQEYDKNLILSKQKLQELENNCKILTEKIQESNNRIEEYRTQRYAQEEQLETIRIEYAALEIKIAETKAALEQVERQLGEEKQIRDHTEAELREQHLALQQIEWQIEKLQETQQERRAQLAALQETLQAQQAELPEPLPSVPEDINLEQIQKEMRLLQKRLQAMEPVNMLALEEYEHTAARLQELSQKLATLEAERTELLLRIENFTTLRLRAFQEAFDAVNQNFQNIFAELSEGDGYLQLDDPEDPFNSGLNLIAHPKGKPVQRLASMSGGEKSLTALSFIFALQRYRPSPFYAFDEVDMFLDGANVERLAKMIKKQAQQAQFIVVSLRRPMIESAEQTIGVTQARGAYTQVIGIKL